jgi:hypothetical protein
MRFLIQHERITLLLEVEAATVGAILQAVLLVISKGLGWL